MHARLPTLAVLSLLAFSLFAGAPALAGDSLTAEPALSPEEIDADEVRMDIALEADGSAQWTIEYWVQLDGSDNEEAFESLREDIEDDPDEHTAEFQSRIDETVDTASEATGREMAAESIAVETERQSLTREYGVLRYTFTWNGFAALEDDEIHAGDAIEGLYIDDGTRLLISWPEGYEQTAVSPEPDDTRDRAVIWHGDRTDFVSGEPQLTVAPEGSAVGWVALAGGISLTLLGGAAVWWFRQRGSEDGTAHDSGQTPTASESTGSRQGTGSVVSETATTHTDPALLSNDEQVIQVLEANGGRVKQQTVKEELGWTDAKTSKVVSSLREDGTVESFRIGRENVLKFADSDLVDLEKQDP